MLVSAEITNNIELIYYILKNFRNLLAIAIIILFITLTSS